MGSVSIAMATLNGARYLEVQLHSIAAQSRTPDELVVCDDGSTDETVNLIERFARTAPFPIRIARNSERLGYKRNFIKAANLCRGELIAFCDQDDVWAQNKLQRIISAFKDPEVLFAFHNATVVDARRSPVGQTFARTTATLYSPLDLPPWTIIPGFSQVFRRSLLRYSHLHDQSVDVYCPSEVMPHDQWFLFLASVLGTAAYLPERLAQYRQHRANSSGWLPSRPLAYAFHSVTHARYYARSASAAVENRLSLLAHMRQHSAGTEADRISSAVEHYLSVQRYAELRNRLYESKSLRRRVQSIVSLVKARAYTHRRANFGLSNLVLDMCVGLPLGPAFRKP